uniref:Uncharacterized protein n=3 Tax=Meloidogyne TaxID=189290 RepID=A0A6V7XAA8_MELEN|nr:unnamed protein product [Meloidogyne enterolobii]
MEQNKTSASIAPDMDCEQTKTISVTKPEKLEKKKESSAKNSEKTITNPTTETAVQGPIIKKQLWKLIRGKFLITFYLCQECQNNLFYSKEKFDEESTGVTVKINLCNKCVDANCTASDVLAPYKKIGTKRKAD